MTNCEGEEVIALEKETKGEREEEEQKGELVK